MLFPLFLGYYTTFIALISIILGILTISWHFMEKEIGWVSFGHSVPFGIAAYLLALNPTLLFLTPFIFLIFLFFSFFGRRLFPFATFIASIALWNVSHYFVLNGKGGEEGFGVPFSMSLGNLYTLSMALLLFCYVFFEIISKSNLGLKIKAVRDDEIAAKSVGIDPIRFKIVGFFFSTTFASVAGVLHAVSFSHVSPSVFSPFYALFPFVVSKISFDKRWACIVGSFVIVSLSHSLSAFLPETHYILYSVVLMMIAVVKKNAENL
ncbi:MAG: branched-chain amino acid ABC transporter permease [Archaeoglobaceae archaeon]|nr:branched-chain amino acid ABC transporter permease [Archaeoglobaceae archaeon]